MRWGVVVAAFAVLAASFGALMGGAVTQEDDSGLGARISYTVHEPIMIMGNAEFTSANGVTGGTGTPTDPFVIEGWEIDATVDTFGIYIVMTTAHFVVRNVHVYGEDSLGVTLYMVTNGAVSNSVFDQGLVGVMAMDSSDVTIAWNFVRNMVNMGIELYHCEQVAVQGNWCENNSLSDIVCMNSEELLIERNDCTHSEYMGVMMSGCNYSSVSENRIALNGYIGAGLVGCREVVVTRNNISNNDRLGLWVNDSFNVNVYHNLFINNDIGAMVGNSTDISWDAGYPMGGNYWSDYGGVDEYYGPDQDQPGEDGIGDTPYIIATGGTDRYPLMTMSMIYIPEFGVALVPVLIVICALPMVMYRRRLLSSERR